MSAPPPPPPDLERFSSLLSQHPDHTPKLDLERPSVEVWVVEAGGALRRWLLCAVGERTVVVAMPRDRRERVLRRHEHVWASPGSLDWQPVYAGGYNSTPREQARRGRLRALALRRAEVAES